MGDASSASAAAALRERVRSRLKGATSVSGDVIRGLSQYLQAQAAGGSTLGDVTATTRAVAEAWGGAVRAAPRERVLPLWYIANDVMLSSPKDRRGAWVAALSEHLPAAATASGRVAPDRRAELLRLTTIWVERGVYKARFMARLEAALAAGAAESAPPRERREEGEEGDTAFFAAALEQEEQGQAGGSSSARAHAAAEGGGGEQAAAGAGGAPDALTPAAAIELAQRLARLATALQVRVWGGWSRVV